LCLALMAYAYPVITVAEDGGGVGSVGLKFHGV
jgi:hypothetical protein